MREDLEEEVDYRKARIAAEVRLAEARRRAACTAPARARTPGSGQTLV